MQLPTSSQLERAAVMLKGMADPLRLRLLLRLSEAASSVGHLAELEGEKIGTISARLKVLLSADLVSRTKQGQSVTYSLADSHVLNLVQNALDHACEAHSHISTGDSDVRS